MTNITETVDIDDYLYDDDEYIDVINQKNQLFRFLSASKAIL